MLLPSKSLKSLQRLNFATLVRENIYIFLLALCQLKVELLKVKIAETDMKKQITSHFLILVISSRSYLFKNTFLNVIEDSLLCYENRLISSVLHQNLSIYIFHTIAEF